jgi:hypothetical protein
LVWRAFDKESRTEKSQVMSIHRMAHESLTTFGQGMYVTLTAAEQERLSGLLKGQFAIIRDGVPEPSRQEVIQMGEDKDLTPLLLYPIYIMVSAEDEATAHMLFGGSSGPADTYVRED